jgi:hypothetical protein
VVSLRYEIVELLAEDLYAPWELRAHIPTHWHWLNGTLTELIEQGHVEWCSRDNDGILRPLPLSERPSLASDSTWEVPQAQQHAILLGLSPTGVALVDELRPVEFPYWRPPEQRAGTAVVTEHRGEPDIGRVLMEHLVALLPALASGYREHVDYYDEPLSHLFMADIVRWAEDPAASSEQQVATLCAALDAWYPIGTSYDRNLVDVSYIENFSEQSRIVPLLGPTVSHERDKMIAMGMYAGS